LVALLVAACGPGGGLPGPGTDVGNVDPPEHEDTTKDSLWPLGAGSTWTYRITDPLKGTFEKTVVVEGMAPVPGSDSNAVAVRSTQPHLEELSYQVVSDGIVFRVREEDRKAGALVRVMTWNPSVMKALAEPKAAGWSNTATVIEVERNGEDQLIDEKEKIFAWTVAGVGETVTTPAGTFSNAVKLRRERSDKDDDLAREYWLVPGVGKVYETGERTEELVRYEIH
jgi:hypothetical protein